MHLGVSNSTIFKTQFSFWFSRRNGQDLKDHAIKLHNWSKNPAKSSFWVCFGVMMESLFKVFQKFVITVMLAVLLEWPSGYCHPDSIQLWCLPVESNCIESWLKSHVESSEQATIKCKCLAMHSSQSVADNEWQHYTWWYTILVPIW